MDFYGILQKYITDEGIERYARMVAETDMERIGIDVVLLREDENVQQINL